MAGLRAFSLALAACLLAEPSESFLGPPGGAVSAVLQHRRWRGELLDRSGAIARNGPDEQPVTPSGLRKAAVVTGAACGLRMQSQDPQWYAFQGYNLGKWAGTSMHIDPDSGDYSQPYVIRKYTLDVTEHTNDGGSEMGVENMVAEATKTLPALETTKTISPDDDFDATPDGAYSLDRRETKVADSTITASLVIEMSLPMSDDERVRCEVVYDVDSKLSLIVLREEVRMVAAPSDSSVRASSKDKLSSKIGGAGSKAPTASGPVATPKVEPTVRAPLELNDIIGVGLFVFPQSSLLRSAPSTAMRVLKRL
jgi:hypothetical protein